MPLTDIQQHIASIRATIPEGVQLICVSKYQPVDAIEQAYAVGERDFGESHILELVAKYEALPKDIRWHMIGHIQTNKVKLIVPFVHLIHSVDSVHLMEAIEKEAAKIDRIIDVLLEVHVAKEESKSGFAPDELPTSWEAYPHIRVCGYMTMATNTEDEGEIHRCFRQLRDIAEHSHIDHPILSMGMSDDYRLAIEDGSTMVRIGSKIFGERNY